MLLLFISHQSEARESGGLQADHLVLLICFPALFPPDDQGQLLQLELWLLSLPGISSLQQPGGSHNLRFSGLLAMSCGGCISILGTRTSEPQNPGLWSQKPQILQVSHWEWQKAGPLLLPLLGPQNPSIYLMVCTQVVYWGVLSVSYLWGYEGLRTAQSEKNHDTVTKSFSESHRELWGWVTLQSYPELGWAGQTFTLLHCHLMAIDLGYTLHPGGWHPIRIGYPLPLWPLSLWLPYPQSSHLSPSRPLTNQPSIYHCL